MHLVRIPFECGSVPMATYIYTTWLQKRADLSPVAAVDLGGMRTQGEWPGETQMNKR